MTNLADQKEQARLAGYARRQTAHEALEGRDNARLLHQTLGQYPAAILAGYIPIRTEISPLSAMRAHYEMGGMVTVPVVQGAELPLKFARWTPSTPMIPGDFGVPIPKECDYVRPEVVIVPMVAFGPKGARLGYGGGYYDRSLEQMRADGRPCVAIGFAYGGQRAADLPIEPTDQRLDFMVTETQAWAI